MTWRDIDPLHVDEEPWTPADPEARDLYEAAEQAIAWWAIASAIVAAALLAVLVAIGIRTVRR